MRKTEVGLTLNQKINLCLSAVLLFLTMKKYKCDVTSVGDALVMLGSAERCPPYICNGGISGLS